MFLILRGRLLLALYDRWQGRAYAAPRLGTCSGLVIGRGQRGRPARTWEETGRGTWPGTARGAWPSSLRGVVNPHFGVEPATGGLGPLRKRQGHHDGDFTVLDGSFRDG